MCVCNINFKIKLNNKIEKYIKYFLNNIIR